MIKTRWTPYEIQTVCFREYIPANQLNFSEFFPWVGLVSQAFNKRERGYTNQLIEILAQKMLNGLKLRVWII